MSLHGISIVEIGDKMLSMCLKLLSVKKLTLLVYKTLGIMLKKMDKIEKITFLMNFDNYLYSIQGQASVEYGDGVHSKHRHIKYHDYFIDNILPGEHVLDIGCGLGVLAHAIATKSQCKEVFGIDILESNIKSAKENFSHDNVTYILGDATEETFEQKFDVVILSNVLEHLKNRSEFLKKINLFVNPKRFIIRVPMFERDWRVPLKKELNVEWRLDHTHEIEYTTETFTHEIVEAGLEINSSVYKWGELWCVLTSIDSK